MTRKPLYLDTTAANEVALDSGIALRIRAYEKADSFYPLRRLSRVIVTGKVEWTTEALLACLEYGVPVARIFTDPRPRMVEAEIHWRYNLVHFYQQHSAHLEKRARLHLNRLWRTLKHVGETGQAVLG